MIPIDAIEDALDQADVREVERAFGALVDLPHGEKIGGSFSADRLDGLLGRVAKVMQFDQSPAPDVMRDAIRKQLFLSLQKGASYANAAAIVARHRDVWRAAFLAHLSGGQG